MADDLMTAEDAAWVNDESAECDASDGPIFRRILNTYRELTRFRTLYESANALAQNWKGYAADRDIELARLRAEVTTDNSAVIVALQAENARLRKDVPTAAAIIWRDACNQARREVGTLCARLAEAEQDAARCRRVIAQMRRYLPVPGETPGECRITRGNWEFLMAEIESLDAARTPSPSTGAEDTSHAQ